MLIESLIQSAIIFAFANLSYAVFRDWSASIATVCVPFYLTGHFLFRPSLALDLQLFAWCVLTYVGTLREWPAQRFLGYSIVTTLAIFVVAMAAYHHQTRTLGLGHTFPIGEPWLEGSALDHMLVSLPYPFGPMLEVCDVGDRQVRFLWLVPITSAERAFKIQYGQEALEERFDACGLEYWDPERASVV